MSINYNKLMEELDNCLGLEKSSMESVKKPVAKVNKAFEGYDDVENELAQEMGLPASETSEDELVFSEGEDQSEVNNDEDEPSKEEVFKEALTNLFSELCENSDEEEARETIKNLVKETICEEDPENCENEDEDSKENGEGSAEESTVGGQSLTDRLLALANGDSATEDLNTSDLDSQDTPATENKESVGGIYDGSDSAFEALCSKMINRYNSLAVKPKKTSTATEGQQDPAPKLDEQALNQVSMEFQYSGKNLRKIVTEAISKGVI